MSAPDTLMPLVSAPWLDADGHPLSVRGGEWPDTRRAEPVGHCHGTGPDADNDSECQSEIGPTTAPGVAGASLQVPPASFCFSISSALAPIRSLKFVSPSVYFLWTRWLECRCGS